MWRIYDSLEQTGTCHARFQKSILWLGVAVSAQVWLVFKHKRQLYHFSVVGTLKFVSIDVVGPLWRSKAGIQSFVKIISRYGKDAMAKPIEKITAT